MSGIKVCVVLDREGLIQSLVSQGHAVNGMQENIPCALVSAGIRTFVRMLADKKGMSVRSRLGAPGILEFELCTIDPSERDWYRGVGDFVMTYLGDVCRDFPDQIEFVKDIIKQEKQNGT